MRKHPSEVRGLRRFVGGLFFLLTAPILFAIGLVLLPLGLILRLIGVEPKARWMQGGCGHKRRRAAGGQGPDAVAA